MVTGQLYQHLVNSNKKIIVCQGGGDAGKTSDILKRLCILAIETPGTIVTVTGQDLPNLKKGALRMFQRYIANDIEIRPYIKIFNKSESTYYYHNNSLIEFTGFDNEQDARGSERDYLFINECNSRTYNLFWQLQRKTRKQVFLDYNPTSKFWVHSKLDNKSLKFESSFKDKVQFFRTWHVHNPFLSKDEHDAYESISDKELYRVYSRGLVGEVKGIIYRMKKVSEIPGNLPFGFGIDIGYTTDKTAIVKVWYEGRNRYYKELLYLSENEIEDLIQKTIDSFKAEKGFLEEMNQANSDSCKSVVKSLVQWQNTTVKVYMANILKENGCTPSTLVWGDHDKNYSNGLRKLGIPYRMARKGPNTVIMGISKVKECINHYIDSPNLENELETYVWQTSVDLLTGDEVTTNQPVDGMPDHILAAIRYFNFSFGMRFSNNSED